jgi:hypothetical protein
MVVPVFWSVFETHEFSEELEKEMMEDYPVAGELHIHHDPCRMLYCSECELNNCPIRVEPFRKRVGFNFEEMTAPTDAKNHH